jgi:hypothetical protein
MAQTSIHLRPCKQSSEIHNKREKELDYVRTDLSQNNEWWSAVSSLGELRSEISAMVKEKTGRKMQAKAEPLREGVVVIQEGTTMEQLQELGRRFQERFGVTPVQIAIHRDEGHWKGEEWKPNLHAHIVFDWYNHTTGKSIKTSKLDAVEMQTITAEVLGMERGVSSEKKHLESARYKAQARQKEIEQLEQQAAGLSDAVKLATEKKAEAEHLQSQIDDLTGSLTLAQAKVEGAVKNTAKGVGEAIASIGKGIGAGLKEMGTYALPSKARDREKAAEKKAEDAALREKNAKAETTEAKAAQKRAENQRDAAVREKESFISRYRQGIANVDLKDSQISGLQKEKSELTGLMEDAASIGLTARQTWQLYRGEQVEVDGITLPEFKDSPAITPNNSQTWVLRFQHQLQIVHNRMWRPVKEWLSDARRSMREWLRQQESPRPSKGLKR